MGLKEAGLRGSLRNVSETTPAFYDVQITGTNEPITEGDTLDVNYQVQNTEDQDGIKDVFLEIDTVEEDRDSNISLSGGATATGTLQWVTQNGEAGTYNAVVLSPDDSDSVSVSVGENAIPDSVVEQFNAQSAFDSSDDDTQVTSWTGEKQSITASGAGATVRSNGINGYRSLEFDGTDDEFEVLGSDWPDTSQPYTIIAVVELFSTGSLYQATSGADTNQKGGHLVWDGSNWVAFSNNALTGSTDSTILMLTGVYDGTNGELREEGTQTASGDIGDIDLTSLAIGYRAGENNDRYWDGYIGFVEVHDGLPSNGLSTREQEVAEMWGITL